MTFNLPRAFRPFFLATAERSLAKTVNLLFDDPTLKRIIENFAWHCSNIRPTVTTIFT
jgi:hypothetical protein